MTQTKELIVDVHTFEADARRSIEIGPGQSVFNSGDFSITIKAISGNKSFEMRPGYSFQNPDTNDDWRFKIEAGSSGGELTVGNGRWFPDIRLNIHEDLGLAIKNYDQVIRFVDTTSGSDTGTGTIAYPYQTVAKALTDTPDVIVIVDFATYEKITIAQSDITIITLDKAPREWFIEITASAVLKNIKLIDMNIDNTGHNHSFISQTGSDLITNLEIEISNFISHNSTLGMALRMKSGHIFFNMIEPVSVAASTIGIHLIRSIGVLVKGNEIRNYAGTNGRAILLTSTTAGDIGNIIDIKHIYNCYNGIVSSGAEVEGSVLNCIFEDIGNVPFTATNPLFEMCNCEWRENLYDNALSITTGAGTSVISRDGQTFWMFHAKYIYLYCNSDLSVDNVTFTPYVGIGNVSDVDLPTEAITLSAASDNVAWFKNWWFHAGKLGGIALNNAKDFDVEAYIVGYSMARSAL